MKPRASILLLTPHLGGGGAEKVIALLARGLALGMHPPQAYEVHVGLITQAASAADSFPAAVTVHGLTAARVRAGAWLLLKLVRRLRPRVVISGMFHLNFLVLLLRPLFPSGTRVVIRQNGTLSASLAHDRLPVYTRLLYRLLYRRADCVICQSAAMAEELARELGVSANRLAVLPNPVEVDEIRARAASSPSLWQGPGPHLLTVARLAPEKGLDLLLGALAIVRWQYSGADLVIAGAGPEEAALKQLCRHLDLESAVRFAGHVAEPWALYPGATAFVLASRHEGLPNALLEAAAAGLPLVTTPASQGLVDLLRGQPGAWLAAEASSEALAAAILHALDSLNPPQRFDHPFIDRFRADRALAAYKSLIDAVIDQTFNGSGLPGAAPMKSIAMIIPGLDRIGGAEQQMLLLARGLHARGWRVSVVAMTGAGGASARALAEQGIAFTTLEMRKGWADPRGWLRFHRWLRRERPDVMHAHLPHAVWLARWSRLAAPVRVQVDTVHSSATGGLGRRLGYLLSRAIPDEVSAVSESAAKAYLHARLVSTARLTILPNGVDANFWKPDGAVRAGMREELKIEEQFLFLAAGRLDAVKDYPTLIAAFAGLPAEARLIIAGSGPLESSLRALAQNLGIASRVRFLGFELNLRQWMQAADAFVLSSRWEGLPMAVLEAAACGLPTVATSVPGTREAVVDGKTGFLAESANAPALRAAMARMMELPAGERNRMGQSARQFVAERFSLDQVLDRWEALYKNLLNRNRR